MESRISRLTAGDHEQTAFASTPVTMYHASIRRLASVLLLVGVWAGPAVAQEAQISTVKGPGPGEETTLSIFPHAAGEGISVRALGVRGRDTTRWALTIIGVRTKTVDVHLMANGERLKTETVTNPSPTTGPHQIHLTKEEFLTLIDAGTAQLTVDDTTVPLPDGLRTDMRAIFKKVV